jgi:hypothetical protein
MRARDARGAGARLGSRDRTAADDGGDGFGGDRAGAQDFRGAAGEVEDGGFDADPAGPAVQHQGHALTQFLAHVLGGGGTDAAEAVGRGGGDAGAEGLEELEGEGVVGHPQAHGVLAAGDDVRHLVAALEDQGERSGPEGAGERDGFLGNAGGPVRQGLGVGQMDDQRVVGRTPFGGEDLGRGLRVEGVGAQAIDGLGGQGD